MSFELMGLSPEILQAVKELGYVTPSPIQQKSIPHAMAGQDVMACAQTGTGKTAAFALPILHRLSQAPKAPLRALVLVPTRELAIQVGKNIREYATYTNLEVTTVFGGVPFESQNMMLRHGVDILVATPGRLIDHMWRGNIDYRNTEFLVLDEADRMLDMGFIDAVREIVREIPTERQTLLFSATLGGEIQRLSRGILKDPVKVEVAPPATTVETVEQRVIFVEQDDKQRVLEGLIREHQMNRAIIFTRTKVGATKLASRLRQSGHRAAPIHSDRSQNERVATLEAFRSGKVHLLVATDIAARGIDVDHVGHVINYDVPFSAEDYVHRIGRTARAGRTGMAIMLATSRDRATLHAIERLVGFSLIGNDRNGHGGPSRTTRASVPERVSGNSAPQPRRRRSGNGRSDRPAEVAAPVADHREPVSAGRNGRNGAAPNGSRNGQRQATGVPSRRRVEGVAAAASAAPGQALNEGPSRRNQGATRRERAPIEGRTPHQNRRHEAAPQAPGLFQSVLGRIFRRHRDSEPTPEAARL